jgi:hypothetical protein
VRGTDVELRGYVDGLANARLLSQQMEGIGVVAASAADADYDPFKDEQLRELHHFETEEENARLRNEIDQGKANHADLVRKYRVREQIIEELRAQISDIRTARANHPEMVCDVHDENDPIQCGWKRAMADIDKVLEEWDDHGE